MAEPIAYFVRGDDGDEYGPVSLVELREWVVENRAGLGTSIRPDAPDSRWSAWQHYPELVALLAEVRSVGSSPSLPVLAPLGRRVLAFGADLILAYMLAMPVAFVSVFLMPVDVIVRMQLFYLGLAQGLAPQFPLWFVVLVNAICFVLPLLYYTGFYAAHGRTPAKALLHLQVVDAQGRKPGLGKAFLRAFVFVFCIYFLYGIPLLYAFLNPQRRALHDIAAGTYVIDL